MLFVEQVLRAAISIELPLPVLDFKFFQRLKTIWRAGNAGKGEVETRAE